MPYRIINWEKYQGRKSRGHNPWVKLYKSILSSASFGALSDKHRWQSLLLLLIADDATGRLDYSDEEIAYKLRVKTFDPNPFLGHSLERIDTDGNPVDASGIPEVDQRRARSSTSTSSLNKKEKVSPQAVEKWFRAVWAVYPRKVSKQDALKAFRDIQGLDEDLARTIIKAVKSARSTRQWNEDGGKYVPYPATWIRGRQWEDELTVETRSLEPHRTEDKPRPRSDAPDEEWAKYFDMPLEEFREAKAEKQKRADGPQGLGPAGQQEET